MTVKEAMIRLMTAREVYPDDYRALRQLAQERFKYGRSNITSLQIAEIAIEIGYFDEDE